MMKYRTEKKSQIQNGAQRKGYRRKITNEILEYIEVKDVIAYNKYDSGSEREQRFDTDSFSIGVDNR